ncbi:serine hydrolase domain-containing protein [Paramicrobacterium sp. CJ85]|uniref:serine hydrolase domain-containing protein n=1 Tax=Paramicrobacterium sp. CJ85 TaxID=3445355 RepID=UPI003F6055FE
MGSDRQEKRSGGRGRTGARRVGVAAASAGAVVALLAGCAAPAATTAAPHVPVPAAEAVGTSGSETPTTLTQSDVDAWLDGILPAALENFDIAGATVSVVSDGEVLTTRGYGYADVAEQTEVDPAGTLFRVGSIAKLYTDTAVMQLVESGDLDLDVDVSTYLDFEIPRNFDDPITLRTLLTHTAGFEERLQDMIRYEGPRPTLRENLATNPPEQVYRPGTTPAYSNYSNGLAGYIVQRVSGVPFERYVADSILAPLGMDSTTFEQPLSDDLADRMSKGYATSNGPASPFELISPAPAGALSTTAADMAQFMLAHLGDHQNADDMLAADTRALMQKPALTADTLGTLAEGPRMTLGFFDESRNGHHILGHGGDTDLFHSHMQLYPDEATGIFLSLNSSGSTATASIDVRNAVMHGFTDRYFPADTGNATATTGEGEGDTDAAAEPTAKQHAQQAAGTYASTRSFHSTYLATLGALTQLQVTARPDGTIVLTPGLMAPEPTVFREVAPWVWQEVGGQQILTMRLDGDQVQTIGFESAFSLNRVGPALSGSIALPVLVASALVLLIALLAIPIGALARRHYRAAKPAPLSRAHRLSRLATRVGSLAALVALAAWIAIISTVIGLQGAPDVAVRLTQVLQGVGVLAIVPAAIAVALGIRHRVGWKRVTGSVLVAAALVGVAWFAITFQLLAPSISV